jgi:hypothetical protein
MTGRLCFNMPILGWTTIVNQRSASRCRKRSWHIALRSSSLFFYNLLPEGSNKQVVCQLNRIDRNDYFGLLLTTAANDTIGAVTVRKQ